MHVRAVLVSPNIYLGVGYMYYIITWRDGHKSRLFTWDKQRIIDLIWNFNVYNVEIDKDQTDHDK